MSTLQEYLETRKKEIETQLAKLRPLQDELVEVEKALRALASRPQCNGCYYVARDSRDGEPSGGCDECRQGPNYR